MNREENKIFPPSNLEEPASYSFVAKASIERNAILE